MTKPMLLAEFTRLPPVTRAVALDGLAGAIDMVAEAAPSTHGFLRYQWFAAALVAYGGAARTILIEHDGDAVIALPFVATGPWMLGIAEVPGGDRPFRGFAAVAEATGAAFDTLAERLERDLTALRIGPVAREDQVVGRLIDAAKLRGWLALERPSAYRAKDSRDDLFWTAAREDAAIAALASCQPIVTGADMVDRLLVRPGLSALIGRALRPVWERGGA